MENADCNVDTFSETDSVSGRGSSLLIGQSPQLASPSPSVQAGVSPRTSAASPMSPDKTTKLREVLSKRRVTPVKSTAPGQ